MPPITRASRRASGGDMVPLSPGLDDAEAGSRRRRLHDSPAETEGEAGFSLAGDRAALALLLVLYTLQGVPMGLAQTVTTLLAEKGASYGQQGYFSFVSWPFSLKFLWAPLVDSVYSRRVGQRRSWLIPVQSAIGLLLLLLGPRVQSLLDAAEGPDVFSLTALFFALYLLAATQDVAVDGWALTLLSRRNVGLASTVNAVGQTLGALAAFTGYVALAERGAVSLSGFMWAWGLAFLASAAAVLATAEAGEEAGGSLAEVYRHTGRLLRLPAVARLAGLLLASRAAFGAAEALTQLKLMEAGMSRGAWAAATAWVAPLELLLPLLLARWTGGERPLAAFVAAYPFRMAVGVALAALAARSPPPGEPRAAFNALVLAALAAKTVASQTQFVAQMAFFARVADPAIGGTAMTLLNTISNLAGKWPASLALFLAEPLTRRACLPAGAAEPPADLCHGGGAEAKRHCAAAGGSCAVLSDAFPPLTAACTLLGVAWLLFCSGPLLQLQAEQLHAWRPRAGGRRLDAARP